jgi:hypothetical protein
MSNTDHNTRAGKSGRRNRKASSQNPKPEQPPSPKADQLRAAEQPLDATLAPADPAPVEAVAPAEAIVEAPAPAVDPPIEQAAPVEADARTDTRPVDTDAPAEPAPVSLQTIAKAYGDYTRKSLEETRSYVEKLKDVRSFDKAVEVQTEFARHAFEIFVAGSQKIYGLHKELARQTLDPMERPMDKPTRDQVSRK